MELADQGRSCDYEGRPHDEGAKNTPEKDAVMEPAGNPEVAEEDDKDKDIVDAQSVFDQVPCEKLQSILFAEPRVHPHAERERQNNPYDAPDCGFTDFDGMRVAVKDAQVDQEQEKDNRDEQGPE